MLTDDPATSWNLFCQPKLTNGTLKERQGGPSFLHRVEHGNRSAWKKQYVHSKSSLKSGMATNTKEIVMIK